MKLSASPQGEKAKNLERAPRTQALCKQSEIYLQSFSSTLASSSSPKIVYIAMASSNENAPGIGNITHASDANDKFERAQRVPLNRLEWLYKQADSWREARKGSAQAKLEWNIFVEAVLKPKAEADRILEQVKTWHADNAARKKQKEMLESVKTMALEKKNATLEAKAEKERKKKERPEQNKINKPLPGTYCYPFSSDRLTKNSQHNSHLPPRPSSLPPHTPHRIPQTRGKHRPPSPPHVKQRESGLPGFRAWATGNVATAAFGTRNSGQDAVERNPLEKLAPTLIPAIAFSISCRKQETASKNANRARDTDGTGAASAAGGIDSIGTCADVRPAPELVKMLVTTLTMMKLCRSNHADPAQVVGTRMSPKRVEITGRMPRISVSRGATLGKSTNIQED
jgi:hypothetical protein